MPNSWTPEREAAAAARCEAARKGPWIRSAVGTRGKSYCIRVHSNAPSVREGRGRLIHRGPLIEAHYTPEHAEKCQADANFIAHARTDLPDAIREIKQLRATCEAKDRAAHTIACEMGAALAAAAEENRSLQRALDAAVAFSD